MVDCIEETGKALNLNNQGIVKYLCGIEEERNNLEIIIQKQYQERKHIEAEIERLTYKLCLINKSLSMRIKAKNNYDKTIEEIKDHYERLVDSSNKLRQIVEKTQQELDDIMNKKTGTSSGPEGGEVRTLYVQPGGDPGPDDCSCAYKTQIPTKEMSAPSRSAEDMPLVKSPTSTVVSSLQSSTQNSPQSSIDEGPAIPISTWNNRSNPATISNDSVPKNDVEKELLPESDAVSQVSDFSAPYIRQLTMRPQNNENTAKESTMQTLPNEIDKEVKAKPIQEKPKPPPPSKQAADYSKNLLLSRLKSTDLPAQPPRQSAITPAAKRSSQGIPLDADPSNLRDNKLIKKSIEDVLKDSWV